MGLSQDSIWVLEISKVNFIWAASMDPSESERPGYIPPAPGSSWTWPIFQILGMMRLDIEPFLNETFPIFIRLLRWEEVSV